MSKIAIVLVDVDANVFYVTSSPFCTIKVQVSKYQFDTCYLHFYGTKGAGGIDGISVEEIDQYLRENWVNIRDRIRRRRYKPQPVRRVEIPKPNGGVRNLGIPTVVDRVIEQAIAQVLTPIVELHFSEYSYGFRPNRSAHQAIIKLLEYFNDGYTYIVDIDQEKLVSINGLSNYETEPSDSRMD